MAGAGGRCRGSCGGREQGGQGGLSAYTASTHFQSLRILNSNPGFRVDEAAYAQTGGSGVFSAHQLNLSRAPAMGPTEQSRPMLGKEDQALEDRYVQASSRPSPLPTLGKRKPGVQSGRR